MLEGSSDRGASSSYQQTNEVRFFSNEDARPPVVSGDGFSRIHVWRSRKMRSGDEKRPFGHVSMSLHLAESGEQVEGGYISAWPATEPEILVSTQGTFEYDLNNWQRNHQRKGSTLFIFSCVTGKWEAFFVKDTNGQVVKVAIEDQSQYYQALVALRNQAGNKPVTSLPLLRDEDAEEKTRQQCRKKLRALLEKKVPPFDGDNGVALPEIYFSPNMATDIIAEGKQHPDVKFEVKGLDADRVLKAFDEFRQREQATKKWSLCGSGFFRADNSTNCSGLLLKLLYEGNGMRPLVGIQESLSNRYLDCLFAPLNCLSTCCDAADFDASEAKAEETRVIGILEMAGANVTAKKGWKQLCIALGVLWVTIGGVGLIVQFSINDAHKPWMLLLDVFIALTVCLRLLCLCLQKWRTLAGVTPGDIEFTLNYLSNRTGSGLQVTNLTQRDESIAAVDEYFTHLRQEMESQFSALGLAGQNDGSMPHMRAQLS